ncbi:energy transducer TonB [Methylomonas sp. SURF-2]|uniref:Protein TonB n=1 Tax=Methylomonas subterranea TaxID=2952225 RepID=A0ABT1TF31_9GAMM|nr:energy transducer TonB [Methylomonas sp. SURF-2]MCQ8104076.1 energy transducer TonB [Methylomonas sp. SURF-2]
MGEERPRDMLLLFMTLVLLIHIWLLTVLMKPEQEITQAEPLVMEVSMIAMSAPKPAVEPPKPAPPPPPKPTPPPKQPPKPKPVVKKPPPVVQEAPDFAPFEPTTPAPRDSQPTANTSSTAASTSEAAATKEAPAFTEANFRANYAHNPKPEYPAIARSRAWQGKVLLRVKVSAEGLSDAVTVEQSSGHEILDESAVEAVKKWRFIPAKRGDTPVASSVIVPIDFKLRN